MDLHAGDDAVQGGFSQASEDSEGDEVDMDRVESHKKAGPSTSQQPQGVHLPASNREFYVGNPLVL